VELPTLAGRVSSGQAIDRNKEARSGVIPANAMAVSKIHVARNANMRGKLR
jgi:hypothetical protein